MNLCDIREVKALLSRHGFHFSKSLGQNFLIADWVPRDIAAAGGGDKACGVLEIGPGIGCLTRELCGRAAKVVSVELDPALPPVLAETMADAENFTLISGDVLQLDIPRLVDGHFQGLTPLVCANLPYNAATPILGALVEAKRFEAITVMVQREAALRLAAKPGTGDYGALSVYMQYHTQPEILFDVPPECFLPAPKVTSSVIRCQVRREPAVPRLRGGIFLPDGKGGLRPAAEDAVQLSLHGVWLPAGEGRHRGGDFAMRAAARSPGRGPGAGGICRPGGWSVRNDTAFVNPP